MTKTHISLFFSCVLALGVDRMNVVFCCLCVFWLAWLTTHSRTGTRSQVFITTVGWLCAHFITLLLCCFVARLLLCVFWLGWLHIHVRVPVVRYSLLQQVDCVLTLLLCYFVVLLLGCLVTWLLRLLVWLFGCLIVWFLAS